MGLMVMCCGMTVKSMGVLAVSVRKMKALDTLHTTKIERVTLIATRR
jgi:uncharacterized protein YunC (DUF1805 family)